MKIGIFEMEHFESAYALIRLFDTKQNQLTIFTSETTYPRLQQMLQTDYLRYQWIVRKDKENKYNFIINSFNHVRSNHFQLLYLSTVSDNHLVYALQVRKLHDIRVVLTVHDINCLFATTPSAGFRKMVQHIGKRLLRRSIIEFNVIADTMLPEIRARVHQQTKVYSIPGGVYENRQFQAEFNEPIQIVIAGSVDIKRRDYDEVFLLAEALSTKEVQARVTFAGEPVGDAGRAIVSKAKHAANEYITFTCFDTFVEQEKFESILDNAHFIYLPSVVETTICDDIPETYGTTKSSGNLFDIIKHAKPYIIPAAMRIPARVDGSGLRYSSINEIVQFLLEIKNDRSIYPHLQENARRNSLRFTVDVIRAEYPTLFRDEDES